MPWGPHKSLIRNKIKRQRLLPLSMDQTFQYTHQTNQRVHHSCRLNLPVFKEDNYTDKGYAVTTADSMWINFMQLCVSLSICLFSECLFIICDITWLPKWRDSVCSVSISCMTEYHRFHINQFYAWRNSMCSVSISGVWRNFICSVSISLVHHKIMFCINPIMRNVMCSVSILCMMEFRVFTSMSSVTKFTGLHF